jgi:hypothetical protein
MNPQSEGSAVDRFFIYGLVFLLVLLVDAVLRVVYQ